MKKGRKRRGLLSCLLTLVLTLSMASGAFAAELQEWDVSRSKTATQLDADYESTVTLSLPSAEEQLSSDIVFVLDQSSCAKAVADMMPRLLGSLESAINETGADINVGVVIFRGNATTAYALTQYKAENKSAMLQAVTTAAAGMTYKGSNMPSGLLAAQQMLAASDTAKSRQYMIMVSDGTTYVYTHDGDPTSHYGRTSGYYAMDGSLYEWQAKYNAGDVYGEGQKTPFKMPASFQNGGDKTDWEKFLSDIGSKRADYIQYDQEYIRTSTKSTADLINPDPICTDETVTSFIINGEESMYQAADVYKQMVNSGVNCYSIRTSDAYGVFTSFSKYLGEIGKGAGTDFSELTNDILYAVSAGSTVEDKMGSDFDLVEDSFELTVDQTKLICAKDGSTYTFGDASKADRFKVVYDSEQDSFVWTINENVSNFARVQLSYKVKLTAPKTEAGTYTVKTNEYATLTPKNSAGTVGKGLAFDVPEVTYTVEEKQPEVIPDYSLTYDANGGTGEVAGASVGAGSSVAIEQNAFTRSGYTFAGWNTQADGKGTAYKAGDTFIMPEQDTVLYAQWTKDKTEQVQPNKDNGGSKDNAGSGKTPDKSSTTVKPAGAAKTGDEANLSLWISLLVICIGAGTAAVVIRRKRVNGGR